MDRGAAKQDWAFCRVLVISIHPIVARSTSGSAWPLGPARENGRRDRKWATDPFQECVLAMLSLAFSFR